MFVPVILAKKYVWLHLVILLCKVGIKRCVKFGFLVQFFFKIISKIIEKQPNLKFTPQYFIYSLSF